MHKQMCRPLSCSNKSELQTYGFKALGTSYPYRSEARLTPTHIPDANTKKVADRNVCY